jgi:hypothetical protein
MPQVHGGGAGPEGKPANAPVAVDFFQRNSYSHRRRLIGGFYA